MSQDDLHAKLQRANKRHQQEFDKYVRMLSSGFSGGRFYTPEQLEKQLMLADQALEDAKAAHQALGIGEDGEED